MERAFGAPQMRDDLLHTWNYLVLKFLLFLPERNQSKLAWQTEEGLKNAYLCAQRNEITVVILLVSVVH